MGAFKSLVDRARAKKDELEKQAARKAAEKAAEIAFARGKEAALAAVAQAGKSLRSAGASIEDALFGPDSEAEGETRGAEKRGATAREAPAREATKREASAREDRDGERRPSREAPTRTASRDDAPKSTQESYAEDRRRFEREVDDELLALKRKIARKP